MSMKSLTVEKITEVVGGKYFGPRGLRNDRITCVSMDSREIDRGGLFVCIKGARVDGHSFARDAVERSGALACLAERAIPDVPCVVVESTKKALRDLAEYYRRLFSIPVVGVIGSVGKTTAKELCARVLSQRYNTLKTPANLNNELGVPLTLLQLREEHEAAVIEMGISDFGEMRTLAKMVRPDIVIFTAVGYCHLAKLGDLHGVLRAKSEVFEFMDSDAIAVLNGDDELLRDLDTGTRRVLYGRGEWNDVRAENVENMGFDGVSCDIVFNNNERVFTWIPAFGSHIVYGALAAAAVGRIFGDSGEQILRGIAGYRPVGGRANVTDTGYITLIDDCYNANPNSMAAAIRSLGTIKSLSAPQNKRVAILGDMKELGADSAELHRAIGELAAGCGIDSLVCCGEESKAMYDGFLAAGGGKARYYLERDSFLDDIAEAVDFGDVVLVKASHSMGFERIVDALKVLR